MCGVISARTLAPMPFELATVGVGVGAGVPPHDRLNLNLADMQLEPLAQALQHPGIVDQCLE